MAYNVSNEYKNTIYGEDAHNRLKIWFNGVEFKQLDEETGLYLDADDLCESLTIKSRIIPDDGKKRFSIGNFVSKEATLVIHDINVENIIDPIEISIGTLVNDEYEYVPIGKFLIQDTPTTDKNKTTIKLRDYSTKFDFSYNASPLIEINGGKATLRQILSDICSQANVTSNIANFDGENIEIGIYDNTIKARNYVSYIAEQAGCTPTIDRNGNLIFIDYSKLNVWQIPLYYLEKYEMGIPFNVERVVYESGIIKYETNENEELSTLYINGANPYIINDEQVLNILPKFNTFNIDSVSTGKVLGNPAIDSYDIIEIVDEENNNNVIFRTLANNELVYKGVLTQKFNTSIGIEERKENVTKNSNPTFRKWAKTEIDNVNAEIILTTSNINEINDMVEEVITKQTATDYNISILSTKDADGNITGVKTSTGYTFDKDGLKIYKDNESFNSLHDNTGTYYKDGDSVVSQTTKDGTITKDLVLYGTYYYGVQDEFDVQNFKKDDAMFIAQLFTDENDEECVGHFYNR